MQGTQIDGSERIGRGVFSSSVARKLRERRALNWRKVRGLFSPASGERTVSADRLDAADCVALTALHDSNARARAQQPSRFHGWFACKVSAFTNRNGTVAPSPTADNPYHCDVDAGLKDRDDVGAFLSAIPLEQRWKERCNLRAAPETLSKRPTGESAQSAG